MTSKFFVYTAISGGYDRLLQPALSSEVQFVCFTDTPTDHDTAWDVRELNCYENNMVLRAKHPKIFPELYLEPCVASMWVDANILIKRDVAPLFDQALAVHGLAFFAHPAGRSSVRDEVKACIDLCKAEPAALWNQLKHYEREEMNYPYPVIPAAYIIFRKHGSAHLEKVMQDWWSEIKRFTARDQISLPYVLSKHKYPFTMLPNESLFDEYFTRFDYHKKRGLTRRIIARVRRKLIRELRNM